MSVIIGLERSEAPAGCYHLVYSISKLQGSKDCIKHIRFYIYANEGARGLLISNMNVQPMPCRIGHLADHPQEMTERTATPFGLWRQL